MTTMEIRDIDAENERYVSALAAARTRNRTVLFDALAAAGITLAVVSFDGSGDSGQIENIEARIGDDQADLPTAPVTVASPKHGAAPVWSTPRET